MGTIKLCLGNSYWKGTLSEIVRWVTGPVYNDMMKQRKQAAIKYLEGAGLKV